MNDSRLVLLVISRWDRRDVKRDVMLQIRAATAGPIQDANYSDLKGLQLWEHFQIQLFPSLVIQLEWEYYNMLWEYFFPESPLPQGEGSPGSQFLPQIRKQAQFNVGTLIAWAVRSVVRDPRAPVFSVCTANVCSLCLS